jgi:hypothetical protein
MEDNADPLDPRSDVACGWGPLDPSNRRSRNPTAILAAILESTMIVAGLLAISGAFACSAGAVACHGKEAMTAALTKKAGSAGERRVAAALSRGGHPAIHDLTLSQRGRSHQLDHIVYGDGRLFVIETKAWTGSVRGHRSDRHWTLSRKGKKPIRVYNPEVQNGVHAEVLAEITGVPVSSVLVSTGFLLLHPELHSEFIVINDLCSRLEKPVFSARLDRAFAKLQHLKDSHSQGFLAASHVALLRFRYNTQPSHVLWLSAALLATWGIYSTFINSV